MPSGSDNPVLLQSFDPNPSIERAVELLEAAQVPFALAGRLAVWAAVPADDHELTKDVDFAVPHGRIQDVERAAADAGFQLQPLSIGGFGIRAGDVRVDFIDRRVDFEALFTDAVAQAAIQDRRVQTTSGKAVPIVPPEYLVAMKLATGDPRDERDVERLLTRSHVPYDVIREVARQYLGPAGANRLDYIGARVGLQAAARYVRTYNGKV